MRTLASDFLDRDIQTGNGHDCLEDTFAAREVILWCLQNTKELGKWAYCRREWKIVDGMDEFGLNGSTEEADI